MSDEAPNELPPVDFENIQRNLHKLLKAQPLVGDLLQEYRELGRGLDKIQKTLDDGGEDLMVGDPVPYELMAQIVRETRRENHCAIRLLLAGFQDLQNRVQALEQGAGGR